MCQKNISKIKGLREEMLKKNISAIVIPNCDPHNSEYLADHWKKIPWISGFTGSAAIVVITAESAGLWTDSRYFIQGEAELKDSEVQLQKMGLQDKNTPIKWLQKNLKKGDTVAMTGDMWPHAEISKYINSLTKQEINVQTTIDLISTIWIERRPALPASPIFPHDLKYAGVSTREKLQTIRNQMKDQDVAWHLVTTLDDIAWICNLRGHDVSYNPVFLAYMLIGKSEAYLYIDEKKQTDSILQNLNDAGIKARSYYNIASDLQDLKERTLVNPEDCNQYLYETIPVDQVVEGITISRLLKACKNTIECQHIEKMMVKDGIALVNSFYWLDQNIDTEPITEATFADKIAFFRSQQEGYYGESFPAIVGYKSNGAINHYRPHHDSALQLKREGILLCDSGGQYVDGTSDITRTIALGTPKEEQKRAFTLVLKGHISLDSIQYPRGTTGSQLDVLARQHLWQAGMNYGHGTGHGVGFFMNVHEPPQGFAPGTGSRATTELLPGMFSSNEPGYYKDGEYGIRIENLVITQKSTIEGFLCHHNVTLYPMDLNMIDVSLLSPHDIDWINEYQIRVYAALSPLLFGEIKRWFEKQCGLIKV
ncbi:MAG: Xaa-Pro aminopeptidase [Saprospiraceae bacterium]|jgi:Xaa-Pro aminopeptidase